MWGQAIDAAVGLTFVFAVTALFCSALVEGFSTFTERRAKYLITALRNMLDAPEGDSTGERPKLSPDAIHDAVKTPSTTEAAVQNLRTVQAQDTAAQGPAAQPEAAPIEAAQPEAPDAAAAGATTVPTQELRPEQTLTAALFNHPLIQSLQTRTVRPGSDGKIRNPQYIPPAMFARALIATLLPEGAKPNDPNLLTRLRTSVDALPDTLPAKRSITAMIDQAEGDLETFQRSLEDWYDGQMGRISGWYKRWAQAVLLLVGFVLAIVANVDTLNVADTLWVNGPVRAAVVAEATSGTLCSQETDTAKRQTCAENEIKQLNAAGLPIGPPPGCQVGHLGACFTTSFSPDNGFVAVLLKLVGWIITAVAVSFGAPFWFDALSKLGNLRSSGPKPSPT